MNVTFENMVCQFDPRTNRGHRRKRYAAGRCFSDRGASTPAPSMRCMVAIVSLLLMAFLIATPVSRADERILSTKKKGTPGVILQPMPEPKTSRSRLLIFNATEWIVGNRSLTKEQLSRRVAKLIEEDTRDLSRRQLLTLEDFYQSKILEDWVDIAFLADAAEAQGFTVTPAELQQKMDALQSASEAPVDIDKALTSMGVTRTEFLDEMRDAILGEKIIRSRLAQAYPEKKLREIYKATPEKFFTLPQVRVSHIFRALKGNETSKEKKVLYNEMQDLRRRALAGEDFAALAKASDAPSKDKGGDIGWFTTANSLPEPLDTLILKLKPGEISKVVESKFGYHILKITDTRPATGMNFEDARTAVENSVFSTVRNDLLQEIKSKKSVTVVVDGTRKNILLAPPQSGP